MNDKDYKVLPWVKTSRNIYKRCNQKSSFKYKYYGAKGIKNIISVPELKSLWLRDKAWLMINPTIDRIDPDGHYELSNCRYIEMKENIARKRKRKSLFQFPPDEKVCVRCKEKKKIELFNLRGKGSNKYKGACKQCLHKEYLLYKQKIKNRLKLNTTNKGE